MISVTILTKNSSKYLYEVLQALRKFDEVLLYDNGSVDETLSIAEQFPNVKIEKGPFLGFGDTHNMASNLAKNDWILSIDSDEVVTAEMVEEILDTTLDANTVYSFPRKNIFNRRVIHGCGWYPDRQYRLYHRKHTKFTSAQVHEQIKTKGMNIVEMQAHFMHYSYDGISDFLEKMQLYTDLFAQQNVGKKSSSLGKALRHGLFAFFKSYFLKKGILDGYEGFVISLYNAHTAYYKYLKLKEINQRG